MTKDEARAELKELQEKADRAVKDAYFKISTIEKALQKEIEPMSKRAVELEKFIYDGKTRFEVFHETGVDPETGKTRNEVLGQLVSKMFGGDQQCNCPQCREKREKGGFDPNGLGLSDDDVFHG